MNNKPVYKRILLKLSGEALAPAKKKEDEIEKNGKEKDGILDFDFMHTIADVLKSCLDAGVEIGVIVGAGNIWRGATGSVKMERARADHMGMLATCINSLALQDVFLAHGMDTVVMSAVEMDTFADHYNTRTACKHLSDGKIVIFAGGTGSPYFSTDTAAALRAAEIGADALLMAKNVDYLYDADPNKVKGANPIYDITYADIFTRGLKAFDMTAVTFCKENNIEAYGFALADPQNIYRAVMGESVGTRMHN